MEKVTVVFIGEEEFGIGIHQVVEILNAQRVYQLPQLPSFLSGVINIRGEVIPLVDLRKRFGVAPRRKKERVVVVRSSGGKVGLLVDGVRGIMDLGKEEIIQSLSLFRGLKTEYLRGLGRRGESVIILLNLETLLSSEEKIQLREMSQAAEVPHG